MAHATKCAAPEGSHDRDECMTAATAPGAARGRTREGASRRKEPEDDLGDKSPRCEVVLEKPMDAAKARAFVTCSYQTSSSRTVVYAKEVEG